MNPPRLEKVVFFLSALVLAWFYGFATSARQWFPNDALVRAWHQAHSVISPNPEGFALPRVYEREGARTYYSGDVARGLTLVPSVWPDFDWNPGLKLIGRDGTVVHEWETRPERLFPGAFFGPLASRMKFNQPQGSHLFPNGDLLVVFSRVGTVRLDACGEVKWRIGAEHHHSVARAHDGSFWISGRRTERSPDPHIPYPDSGPPVYHDVLVHLSEDGNVLETIQVFDIIGEDEDLLRRHLQLQPRDTHLNDVEPLPPSMEEDYRLFDAGDLLVSLKHLNVIIVVDPATMEVEWWTSEPFVRQHDPDFVGGGWIGVFDNNEDGTRRGTKFGGSRIVAVQPHTDSTEIWYSPTDANPLYTRVRGNWQLLDNGNLLVTESDAGRVAEISRDGHLVWEWIQEPYGENEVPVVYWAERYDLTPEQVAEWPCSPGDSIEQRPESGR